MNTKTILTMAVIAALPCAAHATDPVVAVGPAHASSNPVVATANAPYVTVTPTQADESHIATTAYVKGAYNDAIAAVNKVDSEKQAQLVNGVTEIYSNVFGGGVTGIGTNLVSATNEEVGYMFEDIAHQMTNGESGDPDDILMTAGATMTIIREAGQELKSDLADKLADKQDKLVTLSQTTPSEIAPKVLGTDALGGVYSNNLMLLFSDNEALAMMDDVSRAAGAQDGDPNKVLISAGATVNAMRNMGRTLQADLNSKRVEIYTTWNNDNAKQQVAFVTAQ